jgi:hypothetical protein
MRCLPLTSIDVHKMQHNASNYDLKQKNLQHILVHNDECKTRSKIHETIKIWKSNFTTYDILFHQVVLSFIFLHVLIWFTTQ